MHPNKGDRPGRLATAAQGDDEAEVEEDGHRVSFLGSRGKALGRRTGTADEEREVVTH